MVKRRTATQRHAPRGQRGAKGAKGDRGQDASPDYILTVVENQFREMREHLHVQLVRTGQLQVELDRYHREVAGMREELNQVHASLKRYLTTGAEPGAPRDTSQGRSSTPD